MIVVLVLFVVFNLNVFLQTNNMITDYKFKKKMINFISFTFTKSSIDYEHEFVK